MSPKDLAQYLGLSLQPFTASNPARCALFDYSGYYVEEDGKLIALNLSGQQLAHPPQDWLGTFPDLRYLNLGGCQLSACDLRELTELVVLFLYDNPQLSRVDLPAEFPELVQADISACALSALDWPASPQLAMLNVSRQQESNLRSFTFREACPQLYHCNLSHNGLSRFTLPGGFTQLGVLGLEHNQLQALDFADGLPALESLRLQENQLTAIPDDWHEKVLEVDNLNLSDNPLSDVYLGRLESARPAETPAIVHKILGDFKGSGHAQDREVKVLVVGNGGVGKSNIYRRLTEQDFVKTWDSTHGVIIARHPWPADRPLYDVQFWDFGGQDIYHATHRLFLQSSAVYLVAWDPKTEAALHSERPQEGKYGVYRNFQLPYWLDYVYRSSSRNWSRRGEQEQSDAPVIVVQTKRAAEGTKDQPLLDARFARRFRTYQPSVAVESNPEDAASLDSDGYGVLRLHLRNALKQAKPPRDIPANWLELRTRLRQLQAAGKTFLERPAFDELVAAIEQESLAFSEAPEHILADWLHKTGVVYYQAKRMGGRIILDQRWATEKIYAIFQREPAAQNWCAEIQDRGGFFSGADLRRYWGEPPSADEELFEQFMLDCELAYRINRPARDADELPFAQRRYCAPDLLPRQLEPEPRQLARLRHKIAQGPDRFWRLRLYSEFLHTGIVRRLIIGLHRPNETDGIWRGGMILADKEGEALIEVVGDGHVVHIHVEKDAEQLLYEIWREIKELPSLDQPDLIWLSADGAKEVDLDKLLNKREVHDQYGQKVEMEAFRAVLTSMEQGQATEGSTAEGTLSVPAKATAAGTQTNIPPPESPRGPWRICFFAAVLPEQQALRVQQEGERIEGVLRSLGTYLDPELRANVAKPTSRDLLHKWLREDAPSVIHFAGHGEAHVQLRRLERPGKIKNAARANQCGITLGDEQGRTDFVSEAALLQLCRGWQRNIVAHPSHDFLQLLVLNACFTAELARRISRELGLAVVGALGPLPDVAALAFAPAFYGQLHRDGPEHLTAAFRNAASLARAEDARTQYRLFLPGGKEIR